MNASDMIKSLHVYVTVGTVIAYLNCSTYIVFVVVFTLVGTPEPDSNLLISLQSAVGFCWLLLLLLLICLS